MSAEFLSHDEAEAQLQAAIDHPVFFQKLASYGIAPQTFEEKAMMIELGTNLLLAQQQQEVKQASGLSALLVKAKQNLDQVLGVHKQASASLNDQHIDQIASALTQKPDIFNSILSLKHAEAEYVRKQYGL